MTEALDLFAEAKRLTQRLGGTWTGSSGVARCPSHDDFTPSLSISPGRSTVLLHCFAGCQFVDIIRAIRADGDLQNDCLPNGHAEYPVETKDYAPLARRIWADARGLIKTPGERYMQGRGLVGPWTDLRYHPRTPIGSGVLVRYRPAVIAAVRDNSGLVAIHRIAIDPQTARKAPDLENPKLTLGKPKGGAVRLFKAASVLGLAEGIETAKSAAAMLHIPVWATLGNERFPLVEIPFDVRHLILLPDRGQGGDRGAGLAFKAHAVAGRAIEAVPPPDGFNDWNEADQARQGIQQRV